LFRRQSEKRADELPSTSRADIVSLLCLSEKKFPVVHGVDLGGIVGNAHIERAQTVPAAQARFLGSLVCYQSAACLTYGGLFPEIQWNPFRSYIFFIISMSSRSASTAQWSVAYQVAGAKLRQAGAFGGTCTPRSVHKPLL